MDAVNSVEERALLEKALNRGKINSLLFYISDFIKDLGDYLFLFKFEGLSPFTGRELDSLLKYSGIM
jgi:hypothetical protein